MTTTTRLPVYHNYNTPTYNLSPYHHCTTRHTTIAITPPTSIPPPDISSYITITPITTRLPPHHPNITHHHHNQSLCMVCPGGNFFVVISQFFLLMPFRRKWASSIAYSHPLVSSSPVPRVSYSILPGHLLSLDSIPSPPPTISHTNHQMLSKPITANMLHPKALLPIASYLLYSHLKGLSQTLSVGLYVCLCLSVGLSTYLARLSLHIYVSIIMLISLSFGIWCDTSVRLSVFILRYICLYFTVYLSQPCC